MKSNISFLLQLAISFLPFIVFALLNGKANTKKESRNQQYMMPIIAVVYSAVLLIFFDNLSALLTEQFLKLSGLFDRIKLEFIGKFITDIYTSWGIYLSLVLFNTAALIVYVIVKRILTLIFGKIRVKNSSFIGSVIGIFYTYDNVSEKWYIKDHYGQARTFVKSVYYGSCFASGAALLISCDLCMNNLISAPFYPVFAVMIIGEIAFFIDGLRLEERKSELSMQADNSKHVAAYPLLGKPLKALFSDKLSAEGTTVNGDGVTGGSVEDVLNDLTEKGGHLGNNYAAFVRKKIKGGLKPNVDYVRCGYDLATGKSLLFNTPFYDKLNPYVFYAMNRELLMGGKVLVVLGRHGTEDDLTQWIRSGMQEVSNIPDLWRTVILSQEKNADDVLPDIGIITRSGVHDLDIHKTNLPFFKKVSFVLIIEPSRLVTTAQIGLNLLIKCCGQNRSIAFCSVDRNCDGLVDALSHILMTNITEVSATEYPHGISSYMYWTADKDYLQHRIIPDISRCLGMGTELSVVALKNQVKKTVWYGGEVFPVNDVKWIAKQYYYDLLNYANLPTIQESFDNSFQTSFNMCNERVSDFSFVTVEDDRNNLFETRRNFATIAEQQGFVNVISTEYMLREYMSSNADLFTADAKAIPYITADYARTKRNTMLLLCLLMCIDSVKEEILARQMTVLNIETNDPISEIWNEICAVFGSEQRTNEKGILVLCVKNKNEEEICFEKNDTFLFKRAYSIDSGKFESVYTIENSDFSRIILNDLQNASYIAEQESKDIYIGTEHKGHVYQKYLPGQFFTLNGKYYEMVSTTATDNRILVRRASEHIGGRLIYHQIRNYTINSLEDSQSMGTLKTVNDISIKHQFADFCVETPGYWKLLAHNDYDNGVLVKVNGVPMREYHHKQILKLDFSKFGDAFTDSVRVTLTNLLNEVFATLFADNQPFISAITPGDYEAPITYSLSVADGVEKSDKCIFIIEDSQLDIGLLVAAERNINRIFQIVSDYLAWNSEQIEESMNQNSNGNDEALPYHERYYLRYGGGKYGSALDLDGTRDFLCSMGCDGGELRQARIGKKNADNFKMVSKSQNNQIFCSYCGCEISGVEFYRLPDGRNRCTTCSATIVKKKEDIEEVCKRVINNLDSFFGATLDIPISIEVTDERKLKKKLGIPLDTRDSQSMLILGVAVNKKEKYSIILENGAPRISLIATLAHELTHIWQYTHWSHLKKFKKREKNKRLLIYEGMAKWVEIQYLYLVGESAVARREEFITRNRQDEYGIGFRLYEDKYPLSRETMTCNDTPFTTDEYPVD